ncbi:MAG: glycosyltransferase family 4 protein [Rothia sp. (in: high G+C Gram-positive bacteria)]|nr:glycosyltransferase family 4 protein [Rothia sp. (in: high G+C Gram-positive bacteria)]
MKILILTHYYEPEIGAPQRRWSAFVEGWAKAGHEVCVVCPPPHYPDRETAAQWRGYGRLFHAGQGNHGETVVRVPYIMHGFSGAVRLADQLLTATCSVAWVLWAAARGQRPDVIVATVPGIPSLLAGSLLSVALKRPCVAEFRDAWPDVITGDIESQVGRQPLYAKIVKHILFKSVTALQKQADLCVTTTQGFAKTLAARGAKKVIVISNGAEIQNFLNLEHKHRDDGVLRIQYLGTVGRSQGLNVLIEALEILYQRGYQRAVKLRIVGSGSDLPHLKAQAKERGLDLEFLLPVPRERLQEIYSWADVELVSLKDTKPFRHTVPSKIFELLSTQRRIIGLVSGEAAAILRSSGVSNVVPPEDSAALADAIEHLINNPAELSVGTGGKYLLYTQYSYAMLTRRYLAALNSVVKQHHQRPESKITGEN